jgi:two-component system sensor histidine kinase PilS (NtrC family)
VSLARSGAPVPDPASSPVPSLLAPVAVPLARLGTPAADLRHRLVLLNLARLGIAALLLLVSLAFGPRLGSPHGTLHPLLAVALAIFTVSLGYAVVLPRGRDLRTLAVVQIGLDLAAWTAVVHLTGGPASPMSVFFALSALSAALTLGARAARVTAVVAIAIYGTLAVAVTADLLPPLPEPLQRPPLTTAELTFQIVTNVVAVLLVTALGGSLAQRVSRTGGALARVEESRAALAALYEDVLRSIPVALLTCSPTGTVESANPVAATLFDVPMHSLLGSPVWQWLPFLPPDAFAERSAPLAGDASLDTLPLAPRIAYRTAPLYDRAGQARGGIVVIEDRSSVEAMREAVQRAERLAVLGRLAAGLAHEIRNPLGAISGCVDLVRETAPLESEDRELLATVLREVTRLNSLVTDMLAFAKPRPPEPVSLDLVELAREVVVLVATPGARARVLLTPSNPPVIRASADPAQLRQVLWNLVRNAVQASTEGAEVDVAVRAREGAVELAVADRGPGISPELRAQLFDVFYSERPRGTGLGLAIVKQIAEAHGARVEVRDREGGGTEFAFVLPAPTVS